MNIIEAIKLLKNKQAEYITNDTLFDIPMVIICGNKSWTSNKLFKASYDIELNKIDYAVSEYKADYNDIMDNSWRIIK